MLKKISFALIVLTILVVNILRFCWLDEVPYGYNVDELAGAVTITCLETQGTDAHLIAHPLFFNQNWATPKPPNYAYPAAIWTKLFGHKIDRLRAFTAFANTISIIGLFFLGRVLFNSSYGLILTLLASISPWTWCLSRIAYESSFCITFIVWGLFFFFRSNRVLDKSISAMLLSSAMYVYPPCRLQIPFLVATLFVFNIKKELFTKSAVIIFASIFLVSCIPLLKATFWGNLQQRFNEISIFNEQFLTSINKHKTIPDLTQIIIKNFSLHLNPQYLLIKGDTVGGHTAKNFGILSWLDIGGILCLLSLIAIRFKNTLVHKRILLFLIINIALGIIPACLTYIDLPSALRTIGAFPFLCLLTAYGLWRVAQKWNIIHLLILLLGFSYSFMYLKSYFTIYPKESIGWFDYLTKEEAKHAKTTEDWLEFMYHNKDKDYHFRYFLINYQGESCKSSREKWIKFREIVNKLKI